MDAYLSSDHQDAHLDLPPLVENERGLAANPIPDGSVQCPKCLGWGRHNLRLNAYGMGRHFRASCDQCNGWGHVPENDSHCIHEWGDRKNVGNCLSTYTCSKCGAKRDVDSSG